MTAPAPKFHEHRTGVFWDRLRASAVGTYRANGFGVAKGAAYSGLLSFFPILTTVAALLVQARASDVARTVTEFLYEVVPPGSEDVVRTLFVVHGTRPTWLLVVAILLSAWAASGAMMSLLEGFRSIYKIPSGRSFLRERGIAISLVFLVMIPMWAASTMIVAGTHGERTVMSWVRLIPQGAELRGWVTVAGIALRYTTALGAVVLALALIYYVGPNRPQSFRRVLPGAALSTALWLLATTGFGWYVRHIAQYNVLYGSVGAGLALLVWIYLLAVITLYGCAFNAARESELEARH